MEKLPRCIIIFVTLKLQVLDVMASSIPENNLKEQRDWMRKGEYKNHTEFSFGNKDTGEM